MSDLAALVDADGAWTLRFERRLRHPVEKVWRAVAEPAHRDAWFPQRIVGELAPGAELTFVDDPNLPEGALMGRCLAVEPPHLLELAWGDDVLRIELTGDGDATRLVFLDRVGNRRHAARTATGWHLCLGALTASLAGHPLPETTAETWEPLHQRYLDAVGGARHRWGDVPDLS